MSQFVKIGCRDAQLLGVERHFAICAEMLSDEFGLLMCEYIIRYGWYGAPFAFKITDEGKMLSCILAGDIKQDNGYNEWLDAMMPTFNEQHRAEALALRDYFGKTSPKVYRHMRADKVCIFGLTHRATTATTPISAICRPASNAFCRSSSQ